MGTQSLLEKMNGKGHRALKLNFLQMIKLTSR